MGGEPFFIRGLKFQAKLTFYGTNQLNTHKLDLRYMGGEPLFTRGLKFQANLTFYRTNQLNTLLFDIYSSECEYQWEAEESALVRALAYFYEVLARLDDWRH